MNKALWLLGGLGLGTGLMYILDPERGRRRRALARWQVETYRRQANTLLDQTRHALGEQTRTLGQQARGLLTQSHTPLSGGYGPGAMWRERAEQIGGTKGLLMLGCVGLGVGLMYLLDPNGGTRRRALVRDKTRSYWQKTGDLIGKTARDARNRTRGILWEAGTQLRSAVEVPDDTVLEARVRAQLGHAISHGGAIRVSAHQGRVTLSGPISPSAADKLLATVASVAGVTEVVNDLDVRPEHISDFHDGNPVR
jgi:hypothetical protein